MYAIFVIGGGGGAGGDYAIKYINFAYQQSFNVVIGKGRRGLVKKLL